MDAMNRMLAARESQTKNISESDAKEIILSSKLFDPAWYAAEYLDVGIRGMDPVEHYLKIGRWLGRNPSKKFDAKWYWQRNPDVMKHGIDALVHYVRWGRMEGRKIRDVGGKSPRYEFSFRRRFVDRKIHEWDSDREAEFLDAIRRIYSADTNRFDSIPVSIVMPTYNRAYCIRSAINSVTSQSHTKWNLIICDDGSDDKTSDVVQEIDDSRITLIQGRRKGVSAARNAGLLRCNGEYVFYLDSDNQWKNEYLRNMIVFMETGKLDAAYSAAICVQGNGKPSYIRGDDFDWPTCYRMNYVDMNTFAHRTALIRTHGAFDENLRRLVDWDLILRYTRDRSAAFAPFIGVHYDDAPKNDRITNKEYRNPEELKNAFARVQAKHPCNDSRAGMPEIRPIAENIVNGLFLPQPARIEAAVEAELRIGYVLWDWPALSQTFVLNELRALTAKGLDVKVYYKTQADQVANLDFKIDAFHVSDAEDLERLCQLHGRNILHSPFVYPAATLMTWPVAEKLNMRFTLMAGGVDIAHYENMKRNRVGDMTSSPACIGVITLGSFHRDLLIECGVPSNKLIMERQSVDLPTLVDKPERKHKDGTFRVVCIARFIQKKGIEHLIRAASLLPQAHVVIHGYGQLEKQYRNLISELGLDNVELCGPLPTRDALKQAYAQADVFVLPCVRADNGDLDGLPTVLLEAMAMGTPVVTSDIANSPDIIIDGVTGFLTLPGDHEDLARTLKRFFALNEEERRRLTAAARRRAIGYASSSRTVETLETLWKRRKIDITLVTYDVPGYENTAETLEIIRRIYKYTVMDFELFVVDNNSSPEFKAALKDAFGYQPNFHLIELEQNLFCGPASNIGFSKGTSEYAIYICSKEGFILRHGWDLHMVRSMDAQPRAAIGGYPVQLPKFPNGREIQNYPSFGSWRAQSFAAQAPDRDIRHIQGGIFILRRDAFDRTGGFNSVVVHNGMDVEYSYYLESQGYELATITGVHALTTKTMPALGSLMDEHAYIVHPSTIEHVEKLDRIAGRKTRYCNLCGWQGKEFLHKPDEREECPQCGAGGFDRSVYRILSQSGELQTRPFVSGRVHTAALDNVLSRLCPKRNLALLADGGTLELKQALTNCMAGSIHVFDHAPWNGDTGDISGLALRIGTHALSGGMVLIGEPEGTPEAMAQLVLEAQRSGISHDSVSLLSDCCRFNTKAIHVFSRKPIPRDLQGLDS